MRRITTVSLTLIVAVPLLLAFCSKCHSINKLALPIQRVVQQHFVGHNREERRKRKLLH